MRPVLLPPAAIIYCDQCNKYTRFFSIISVSQVMGVSRQTVYNWIGQSRVHCLEIASGRRVICERSLSHKARELDANLHLTRKKLSKSVKLCQVL
jgi:hypothetical protein